MSAQLTPELRRICRRLKLSPILHTLPERATLARQRKLAHVEFLELVLAGEVERRDAGATMRRVQSARLDPEMNLERFDPKTSVSFDHDLWAELCTLSFTDDAYNVLILGPVGVGKTFMASCLGHIACRRGMKVVMSRADHMLKSLKASRLDHTHEAEMRRLIRCELLIVDDFALRAMDPTETTDVYELIVERHRKHPTVVTSNRDPVEWLASMADPLLAQSAVDRLQSAAYELVVEGESYRKRQKPTRRVR